MSKLLDRIAALEKAAPNKKGYRPLPLGYFYGEPLPPDFYTNDKYIQRSVAPLADFYLQDKQP
jgi:hypothetical protein